MYKDLGIKVCEELRELQGCKDTETAHYTADELLCEFLTAIGYEDVVEAYNKINKWYA